MEQATESSKTSVEESVVVVTRDVVETTETTTSTIILENKSVETKEQVEENTASKKKALSKEAYLKLHRSSFHNPKSSTSSLKEKFEQSENVKTESCQSVKTECESSEIKTTVNSVQNTSETASEDSQESKTADNCSDAISQTTSNIEKLQNQLLANKVAPQAVESLRQKYSPSSYGYPKTAALEQKIKKVTFAPSPTVKPIPLPKPQKLASPTSPTPEKHVVVIKEVTPKSPVLITKFPINEKPSTENDTATNILEEKDAIEKKIDSAVPQEKDSLKKDTLEKKEKPIPPVRRSISLNSNQPKVQLLSSATQVSIEKVDKSEKNVQTSPCENKVIAVQTQTENEKVSIRPPVPKKPSRIPERRPISAIHIPKKDQVINRSRPLSNIETKKKKPVELPKNIVFADPEDHHLIVCRSSSEDSEEEINRVKSFLDDIDTMEKKKEKKRSSSFRKILTGSFFSKDKKKDENKKSKDEEKKGKTKKVDNHVMSDNVQNESNFSKGSSRRNSVPDNTYVKHDPRCSTSSNSKTNGSYTQDKVKHKMQQQNIEVKEDPIQVLQNIPKEVEERFAEMHINHYNRIRNNFENNEINQRYEGYVDMDNSRQAKENFNNFNANCKYIDTSSTNTTSSESKSDTYENALIAQAEMMQRREQEIRMQQEHNERVNARHRFMVENQNTNADNYSVTPPRAHDTYQSVQLIKPQKAHIPINSERPLPNPYHNGHQNVESNDKNAENEDKQVSPKLNPVSVKVDGDNLYGTVYDIKSVPAQVVISRNPQGITSSAKEASVYLNKPSEESRPMSPVSPKSVEGSKLRLPPNREKVELQPRIKSPIPQTKISTDKIIATELLKNKADKKDDKRSTPSHQRLEIEIDYPEGQRRSIASLSPRSSQMSPKSQLSPRSRSSLVETSPSHRMRSPAETTNSLLRVSPMQQQRQREELNTTPINHGKSIVMNEQSPKMAQNDWKNEQVHSSTPYNLSTNQSENGIDDQSDANVNNINISKSSNLNSPSSVHSANPSQSNLSTNSLIAQNNMQGRSPNLYAYSPNSLSPRSAQSGRYPSTQEIRPVTPVNASQTLKVQSPSKAELRQHVEAFCWKELKKLKEKEEQEIYQLQISNYGYAEDPVRRCRSVSPTTARGRRSLSLPRSNQRAPRNQQQPIPENRPPQPVNPTYGYIATTLPQNQFLRNSPQRRTVDVTYKRQDQEVDYRPIFKRGSLTPQNYQEQNVQISKKVSFPHGAVQNGQQNWPTKNGFTKSPPTRRLEKRESYVEDEVFLPPEESNQSQNMQNYMTYETPHGNKFTVPMGKDEQAKQELYGTNPNDPRQFAPNEDPYGTARGRPQNNYMSRPSSTIPTSEAQIKPAIENPYGSRTNDPRQFVQNEDPYGTARGRSTQSNYGSRPSSTLPIKNSEQDPQIKTIPENPYGSRQFIQNEDPYGQTRGRQMARSLKNELSEDPRMKAVEENPYGSRSNDPRQFQVPNEDSYGTSRGRQPSNYLPRPPSALAVNNVEPDGRGPKLQYSNSFRRNDVHDLNKQIRDNLLAKDASRNGALRDVRNIGNPDYVSRQQLNHGFEEQQRLGNVMYDPRRGPPMERYTSRQTLDESPYGSRQMIRGYPQDYQRNYQESPYGSRQSFASSTQLYGSKQSIQDPIYIQRQVTVSNKVCDMYGKIHEPGQPLSPTYGPVQEKGVLYGQLSRNPRGMTPQFDGNYPPLPPGNFIRGSRLTASANDMYKRHPQMAKRQMDNSMNQQFVYESRVRVRGVMPPPNDFDMMNAPTRPLPPIPNESKSKFLLMRRESARRYAPVYDGDTSSETSEVQRIMQNASQKPPAFLRMKSKSRIEVAVTNYV